MHFANPDDPPPYEIVATYPSLGLLAVHSFPDGVLLDFATHSAAQAVQLQIPRADAQKMLHALQHLLAILQTPQTGPTSPLQ